MRLTVSSIAQRAATSVVFTLILAACSNNKTTSTAPATPIATKIVNKSGDTPLVAPVGTNLISAASVEVLDQNGNPLPGVTVSWTAYDGSSVPVPNSITDANGIAVADWAFGTVAGVDSLQASVSATLSTYFVGTAQPGPVAQLVEVSGDQQQVAEGGSVQLVVQAVDQYGNAVPNASVVWVDESGGVLSGTATSTDANGLATATLTADLAAEQYLVMAEIGNVTVTFTDVSN
jgi:adhesin/invasin